MATKPPIRLKFEDRGLPRRVWVAYLEKDGSQFIVFAPGMYLARVLREVRYFARAFNHA